MEHPFGPLPSDDDGVGVSFVENEDSSKRARVDPSVPPPVPLAPHATTIAMMNKALGDRQLSKKEALKLRKQLDLFIAEDTDEEKTECCFRTLKRNRMSCRCFSDRGNDGWRIATTKGSYGNRFQKSRSTTIGKRKVFNTRFDVLSEDVESSKTPSSSPRLSGFCDSPSLVNTEKVASGHDDFQQALKDPDFVKAVRGLELCLKIRERERFQGDGGTVFACDPRRERYPGCNESSSEGAECLSGPVAGCVDNVALHSAGSGPLHLETDSEGYDDLPDTVVASAAEAGEDSNVCSLLDRRGHSGAETAHATAVESKRFNRLLEVTEPVVTCTANAASAVVAKATAGESKGIIGLSRFSESEFPSLNSSRLGSLSSACARRFACSAPAVSARVCPVSSSSAVSAVAHAHASTLHGAHNSWSDTVRVQGPTGTRRVKGGVSGPAEDLRPVSEVEAGVNFRPAGGVRGQVASSIPRRQPGTGTRRVREGAVTPSLHPEVPGIQFVSPGYGLDIRQSMGWTKVCETARSGIWVLTGIARTCMFPANLDHLRVEWMKRGSYKTAWVTPGHDCLCSYKYGHGAAVRPQTNNAIWDGVIGLWGRVAPFLSPWCGKKDVPTGVNLNQYAGPGSFIRWHSDNEPLFGPQNSPKLIVSLSLGNSVEFMVRRRASGNFPSSIRLDHGDVLVMDALVQSEYEHCTASELQGPRVNLTYRWVAQHTASCPLAGVVGCLLPTCVQGLVEPGSRWLGEGEINGPLLGVWSFFC